ncbi:MAG: hypothetical protein NT154_47320, partial [Verrucomicrobia bacterium]|nr:hypothetical protein [Verrucomicrobiota bacterium]
FKGPYGSLSKAAHLADQKIFWGHADNARKLVNGIMALTPDHAEYIRAQLKMSGSEWDAQWAEITERRGWELTNEGIEKLTEFFGRLRRRGLEEAVAFSPRHIPNLDLASFCVPARVITEEEWSSLAPARGGLALDSSSEMEALLAKHACGVLFNGWLGRAHQRVVVQGEPGEGKTTAVWLYIDELCRRWEESLRRHKHRDLTELIPLALPLDTVPDQAREGVTLTDLALQHVLALVGLATGMADAVRSWLGKKLAAGQYVLMLDALDELPAARLPWLRTELAGLRGIRVVLTSRYHADPRAVLAQYTLLRMVPLRWWIIDEFITRYFDRHPASPKLPNALRRTLRQTPALRQLSRNPFLLGAMCHLQAADQGSALPTTKAGLLHQALRSVLKRGDARRLGRPRRPQRDEAKIAVLAEVAWHFQQERPRPMPEDELLRVLNSHCGLIIERPPAHGAALLQELVEDGVLVRRSHGPYTFLLRRFQEYCLARHVAQMANELSAEEFQGRILGRAKAWGRAEEWTDFRPLNQPGWVEVWPLAAGCMEGNDALLEALDLEHNQSEDLVFSRLRLLTTVLAEFLEANRERAVLRQRWEPLAERVAEAVLALAQTELTATGLIRSWQSCLAQLPAAQMVAKLVTRIIGSNCARRSGRYAIVLGEIGTSEARQYLQMVIANDDADEGLRADAAAGLGLVGDAPARNELLTWLKRSRDVSEPLHFGCITGLSYVADVPSRQALVELLTVTGNAAARWQCIRECERLFGPEIESKLLEVLERFALGEHGAQAADVEETMEKCAQVLGRIGTPDAARRMLALLRFSLHPNVKRWICAAVAETGDGHSRETLRRVALDSAREQKDLANHAALALIRVGDESALARLLATCSNSKCSVALREAATSACQECTSELALDFVIQRLMEDPSLRVKYAAVMALDNHSGPRVLNALRCASQLNLSEDVHFQCVRSLAAHGDEAASRDLIEMLHDKEFPLQFRMVAAHTLGKLNSSEARSALRRICEDSTEVPPFRIRCAEVLAILQREQGWRPLIDGTWQAP